MPTSMPAAFLRCASVLLALAGLASTAQAAASSFDSVAEFSDTQGQGGWQYGYYSTPGDASTFTLFSVYSSNTWMESTTHAPWTLLWAEGGHPNGDQWGSGSPQHDAVRRWTSGASGTLQVSGSYQMGDGGNTLVGLVLDGNSKWSAPVDSQLRTFHYTGSVHIGSMVDFVINSNGADFQDTTLFKMTGSVTAVPEPESYATMLAGLGAVGLLAVRRRRR